MLFNILKLLVGGTQCKRRILRKAFFNKIQCVGDHAHRNRVAHVRKEFQSVVGQTTGFEKPFCECRPLRSHLWKDK